MIFFSSSCFFLSLVPTLVFARSQRLRLALLSSCPSKTMREKGSSAGLLWEIDWKYRVLELVWKKREGINYHSCTFPPLSSRKSSSHPISAERMGLIGRGFIETGREKNCQFTFHRRVENSRFFFCSLFEIPGRCSSFTFPALYEAVPRSEQGYGTCNSMAPVDGEKCLYISHTFPSRVSLPAKN